AGGEPEALAGVGGNATDVTIAALGQHRLAYVRERDDMQIWRTRRPRTPDEPPTSTPLVFSSEWDEAPQYSPDGKRIAFMSRRSGSREIHVCDSEGRNPIQLTSFGSLGTDTPRWSPDGQYLAFQTGSNEQGRKAIFVLAASLDRAKPRRLTYGTF